MCHRVSTGPWMNESVSDPNKKLKAQIQMWIFIKFHKFIGCYPVLEMSCDLTLAIMVLINKRDWKHRKYEPF